MKWLKDKVRHLRELKKKGIEVTEQMRAEKLRKKMESGKLAGPGTIKYGLATKQSPFYLLTPEQINLNRETRKLNREAKRELKYGKK